MCLPSLGDIDRQSIAGVISTGTHGTGMQWGSFSDSNVIIGMEIVLADGVSTPVRLQSRGRSGNFRGGKARLRVFGNYLLGDFAVCQGLHSLRLETKVISSEEALQAQNYRDNDHFEFFNFPFTDKVLAIYRNISQEEPAYNKLGRFLNDVVLENVLLGSRTPNVFCTIFSS